MSRKADLESRIIRNSVVNENGCWVWKGSISSGYGIISMRLPGRKNPTGCCAHRVSYEFFKRKLNGLTVDHTCRNPLCVNPNHLVARTMQKNLENRIYNGKKVKS